MTETLVAYLEQRRNEAVSEAVALVDPDKRDGSLPDADLAQAVDDALARAAAIDGQIAMVRSRIKVKSEPLTYRQDVRASFYQDMVLTQVGKGLPGSVERLERHAREMEVLAESRERAALRELDAGGFEYRVEPNTTPGTGGYATPPLWLNKLFAPGRHPKRVLADLIPLTFALPQGVSSINLPILQTGTVVQAITPNQVQPEKGITDAAGTSAVVMHSGMADFALQLLELSPPGAHLDWVFHVDLSESYDGDLETDLINGGGSSFNQLVGVANVANQVDITYTDGSPTGPKMWNSLGQAVAQVGDGRDMPPEVWLMRTARWAWLNAAEDNSNRPLGLASPFFLGNDDQTPDPISGIFGFPAFLDDAIPNTLGVAANQDLIICLRPSDIVFLEGTPQVAVDLEPNSGVLGARIIYRNYSAAVTNRYAAGIAAIAGTGMAVNNSY